MRIRALILLKSILVAGWIGSPAAVDERNERRGIRIQRGRLDVLPSAFVSLPFQVFRSSR